jgi:prepilin-type N-terminal cleavage/methylation domain-containing protein
MRRRRTGFSLLELLVVIAVTMMLTGLMMPALRQLHENAHRVICMSNMQQLGQGFLLYGNEHNDALPYSHALHTTNTPQNLMAAKMNGKINGWDGIGLLFSGGYCTTPDCYYCPSHHGKHPIERYATQWSRPVPGDVIFTNYHYAGDMEWTDKEPLKRRSMLQGQQLVLATDGLRSAEDFNHTSGMNVLRADISVRWRDDTKNIFGKLPKLDTDPPNTTYNTLWEEIEALD